MISLITPIPTSFKKNDTTDAAMFAPYLDRNLKIGIDVRLRTKPYDKLDHYNFPIVNLPFICNNISAVPAYGVYIF